MQFIYTYLGIIFFWIIVLFITALFIAQLLDFWREYKGRFWVYQIYERFKFDKYFNKLKNEEFKNTNIYWAGILIYKNRLEGKVPKFKYYSRKIFKNYYLACYNELLSSEAYKEWKALNNPANVVWEEEPKENYPT
jgi:hypothetical protein